MPAAQLAAWPRNPPAIGHLPANSAANYPADGSYPRLSLDHLDLLETSKGGTLKTYKRGFRRFWGFLASVHQALRALGFTW